MAFYTAQLGYFTDPGALTANVSHAQADAVVAAAAGVWNVPTASLVLQQSGVLAEHVNSANTSLGSSGPVFPADVAATNYQAIPMAVIYDTDGSVTDLLLGDGASAPASCLQHGVTESVDAFGTDATLHHALLILNGRCVGANPQQLLQMQYQLMRAFGRVLGLAWAQVNDNVFTGATQPTAAQMANWPVMHPIDILCGPYSYQCMQNPFQLRLDDLASLAMLYPVSAGSVPSGKTASLANADKVEGWVTFPTGQGMQQLNVTVTEVPVGQTSWNPWQSASSVSGIYYRQNIGNPVTGPETASEDVGNGYSGWDAYFGLPAVPLVAPLTGLRISEESINPLYTGDDALGPYERPPASLSGSPETQISPFAQPDEDQPFWITMADAPASCNPGNDGTESVPVAPSASGFTTGLLCGMGHNSWFSVSARANRSWTLEATALDETGAATTQKAQLVLGLWNATDATGQLPTVAAQPMAMNAMAVGGTKLDVAAQSTAQSLRLVVADQFGWGRPDFAYSLRVLYADAVQPTTVGAYGGQITISGTGFRGGNKVLVNGVAATVVSSTATQIVAIAPPLTAVDAGVSSTASSSTLDVAVEDAQTLGSTVMQAALTYDPTLTGTVSLTPSQSSYVAAGATLQIPQALTATQAGIAASGLPVTWSASGAVTLAAQQATTAANGVATASAVVTAIASGATGSVTACGWTNVCASWGLVAVDPASWAVAVATGAGQSVAVGRGLAPVSLQVTDGAGHPLLGAPVMVYQTVYAWEGGYTATSPAEGPCPAAPVLATQTTSAISDANGLVQVTSLSVAGVPQEVQIAAVSGGAGFVSLSLVVHP